MAERDVLLRLKQAYQAELLRAPSRHRLRTPQCPAIPALLANRLSAAEQEHVRSCRYCGMILSVAESAKPLVKTAKA